MWFSKFNDYFMACHTRYQKWVAIKETHKDQVTFEVLPDDELPLLLEAPDMSNGMAAQRWFAVIIGRCRGWRPDTQLIIINNGV